MVEIRQTVLPGVGIRHDFRTADGTVVGVITYRTGRSELFVCDPKDPDTPREMVDLDEDERSALVELLGGSRIIERLAPLQQDVEGLAIDWIEIPQGNQFATIGQTEARTRTGVSIVAVLREGTAAPAPGPEHRLRPGDVLVVVGTSAGIRQLVSRLSA